MSDLPDRVLSARRLREDRWERSKRLGWFDPEVMRDARVLVVGAGALGNEVVKNLVLSGAENILLVDMDRVERSNLNRCVFFTEEEVANRAYKAEAVAAGAKRLAPSARIDVVTDRIESLPEQAFADADVAIACVDNVAARLHLNVHARPHDIPLIDGGTQGMLGKVQVVWDAEDACLECTANASHRKVLDLRFSCTGADVTVFSPKLAAEITTTAVVSAIETREALKALHGLKEKRLRGLFYYDGMSGAADVYETERNGRCPHHAKAVAS